MRAFVRVVGIITIDHTRLPRHRFARQTRITRAFTIAEAASALRPEKQHTAAAAWKDDPAYHGRAIPEDPTARIPGAPPDPDGRVAGRIVDQGDIWHRIFDAQVSRI